MPAAIARRWKSSGPTSSAKTTGALAFDLYFMAMSHHRLGETARARDYYDCAVRWAEAAMRPPQGRDLEELAAFRAETEELLGLVGTKD